MRGRAVARAMAVAAAGVAATALPVIGSAPAAGASPRFTATTSGTALDLAFNQGANVTLACVDGVVAVYDDTPSQLVPPSTTKATPELPCAQLSVVRATGGPTSTLQWIDARPLEGAAFAAKPHLEADLGGGPDYVWETTRADDIDLGFGNDHLYLAPGTAPNVRLELVEPGQPDDDNWVHLVGTSQDDTITASTSGDTTTVAITTASATTSWSLTGVGFLEADGAAGDDELLGGGVEASAVSWFAIGGPGDDLLVSGPAGSSLYGGPGTNRFELGTGADGVISESATDTIVGAADGQIDRISDQVSLRSGGRTLVGFDDTTPAGDTYQTYSTDQHVIARTRPGPEPGSALVTLSLDRMGQQVVPSSITSQVFALRRSSGGPFHRVLVDAVVNARNGRAELPYGVPAVVDVTVPVGSYTVTNDNGDVLVTTADPTISNYRFTQGADYRVHGPWTDPRQGFAHRVTRDLLMRFASDAERDQLRDRLAAGTTTRRAAAEALMATAEYRGLDVDRVFLRFLRRNSDPQGRAYWIGSLGAGKPLWRFRAQLLGSNEYFTKAGKTNEAYVRQAYADVLGREPDPSGAAYWTKKLDAGADRGGVALRFLDAPEVRRRLVDDQFLRFLDRLPSAAEQARWVEALRAPTGEQDLIAFLAASNAYYQRS